ncbi:MAG: putative rane protein [Sedimentibacter sp.]|nr:putative rane protein [Sedimentibacter sp.]
MNRNFKTSSITESAMITGILVILAYLSNFFSLVMFFYPTPAIILAKRKGLKYAALSLMASDILVSMLLGIQTGMIFLILYTPLAIALAYGVCKDDDANKTILYGSAAYMVSFVVLILHHNKCFSGYSDCCFCHDILYQLPGCKQICKAFFHKYKTT